MHEVHSNNSGSWLDWIPPSGEKAMSIKPGLTRKEHEELGAKLKQLRDEVLCISVQLDTAYPKLSPAARLSYKAAQAVDRLRRALDRQAFRDYCQWEAKKMRSLKGRGRIFLALILITSYNPLLVSPLSAKVSLRSCNRLQQLSVRY
jgi:hypothetical protein